MPSSTIRSDIAIAPGEALGRTATFEGIPEGVSIEDAPTAAVSVLSGTGTLTITNVAPSGNQVSYTATLAAGARAGSQFSITITAEVEIESQTYTYKVTERMTSIG